MNSGRKKPGATPRKDHNVAAAFAAVRFGAVLNVVMVTVKKPGPTQAGARPLEDRYAWMTIVA